MKPEHYLPADIERTSLRIITEELAQMGLTPPPETEAVVRRVIHTTADFDYAKNLCFTPDAVAEGVAALRRGATLVTDTNMTLAGVSKPGLSALHAQAVCYMADPAVAERARQQGTTRAVASMEYALSTTPNAIFAIGNAPTALISLSEHIRRGARPAMVIGVPVGFVNVEESKRELFDVCSRYRIPAIVAMGRKGGSTVAAAVCNALIYSAAQMLDPSARGWQG